MMYFKRFWLAILIVLSVVGSVHSADIRTGGGHLIEDEGSPLTQRSKLNFIGDNVTCTDDGINDGDGVKTDCTIGISTGFINVMNYGASGIDTTTTLSSDLACASTSVNVADASSFVIGQGIMIEGANKGNPLVAKITGKAGNTLSIDTAPVCDSESYLADKAPNDTTANDLTASNSPVQASESIQGSKHLSFDGSDATIQNLFTADNSELDPSEVLVCGSFQRDDITNSDLFFMKYQTYQINFDATNAEITGFTNNTSGTASTTLSSPIYSVAGTDTWYFACISHHKESADAVYSGTKTGISNQATLTDSLKSWVTNSLLIYAVNNLTDGSSCMITANTATTVTCTLTGGTENDWDVDDSYTITKEYDTRLFLNGSEVARQLTWTNLGLNQTANVLRLVSATEGWHGNVDWFVIVDITSTSYTVSKLQRLVEELYNIAGDSSCSSLTTTNLSELVGNADIQVCYDFESLQSVAASSGAAVYHDDSQAIKDAIDSGYNVYIPRGHYNWSSKAKTTSNSGLTIKGSGADDAHTQPTSVTNGTAIHIRKNNSNILKLTGDGVIVEDIEFLSDKYNAGSGSIITLGSDTDVCVASSHPTPDANWSTNITLRNIVMDSHDSNAIWYYGKRLYGGILVKNVYKASISQMRIHGMNGHGVLYDIPTPCGDVDFSNSVIDNGGNGAVGILIRDSDYNKFTSIKVTNVGNGVWLRPDMSDIGTQIFVNLGTEDYRYYGIRIGSANDTYKAYRTQVIGGKIAANSNASLSKIGLYIDTDAQHALISNIYIDRTNLPIYIQGDYVNLTGAMVTNESATYDALRISTGASNVQISGGYFSTTDVAESSIQCYQADRVTLVGNRIPQGFNNVSTSCTNVVTTGNNPPIDAGSITNDLASIADGAGSSFTISVTGASFGDKYAVTFSGSLQGVIVTAYVSSANVVTVRVQNETGAAVDFASGTWTLRSIQ